MKSLLRSLHRRVYESRVRALTSIIAPLLRPGDKVLDVGCGSGQLAANILNSSDCPAGVVIEGLEVRVRGNERIPVREFNGTAIPYPNDSFNVIVLADVLHHTTEPHRLIAECKRVARRNLIIKDHKRTGVLAQARLSFIDWAANIPYDVPVLYKYNTLEEWRQWHRLHGLRVEKEYVSIGLYPPILEQMFGGELHYAVLLTIPG